jgi:hypothetical protein
MASTVLVSVRWGSTTQDARPDGHQEPASQDDTLERSTLDPVSRTKPPLGRGSPPESPPFSLPKPSSTGRNQDLISERCEVTPLPAFLGWADATDPGIELQRNLSKDGNGTTGAWVYATGGGDPVSGSSLKKTRTE